ncbi:MAG: type I DNA topoisomerase [Actinomycetota bacterium]
MAKNLVVVESPAKAKTIEKYLGRDYRVLASVGHVRDLPENRLGIEVEGGYALEYVVVDKKKKAIAAIGKAARTAEAVYLATDYDREGEAIAWHVTEACRIPPGKQRRITFTEITRRAVTEAIANPRDVDVRLVDAQQARRGIDRLVGYPVSQLLWQKIRYGLSAGRVQSPALRLVVEREREIAAFVPTEYWTLEALLATEEGQAFTALLVQIGDRRIPTRLGRESDEDVANRIPEEARAQAILAALDGATWQVREVRTREQRRIPQAPFITSSYQQEASRKLGLTARRAMSLAQALYERGFITYMRTDSTTMSGVAIADAESLIRSAFGDKYWGGRYRQHDRKVAGAQEAHECIRPTEIQRPRREVEAAIRAVGGRDAETLFRVYDLVWKRSVASLMAPALFDQVSADIVATPRAAGADLHLFRATGSTLKFDGFIRLYLEGRDDEEEEEERRLPPLAAEQPLDLRELRPEQHFTQPPPRYTEASLVKELEERGIGRPSTYASIIATLTDTKRDYTRLDKKRFVPTDTGQVTTDFLLRYFGDHFMDFTFTSDMEERLDEIAEGELSYRPVVEGFHTPLQDRLNKAGEVPRDEVISEVAEQVCPECGSPMVIKLGRRGKFLACTNYPECKKTLPLPGTEREEPELLDDLCPECGSQLQKRIGRFGPFVGCSRYPDCRYIKKKEVRTTGAPCPHCLEEPCKKCTDGGKTGELVERSGRRGRFFGCSHYPACRHTQNQDPREAGEGAGGRAAASGDSLETPARVPS